jgi:hypothetical protein
VVVEEVLMILGKVLVVLEEEEMVTLHEVQLGMQGRLILEAVLVVVAGMITTVRLVVQVL